MVHHAPWLLSVSLVAFAGAPEPRLWQTQVRAGGVAVVEAPLSGGLHPIVRFRDTQYKSFPHPQAPEHRSITLVPIPVTTPPGSHVIQLEGVPAGPSRRLPLTVQACPAPVLTVRVDPSKVEPSAEDKVRIQREREEILAIYASPEATPLWTSPFAAPVGGVMTCRFGTARRFNGKTQNIHKGMDLRAATGTPTHAPAAGRVRLAKDLFFGGNLVLIDHGCGLFSALAHLSRIDVAPGQAVSKGQRIGLSGATGRVSAPHLHWGTSIQGVEVDPLDIQRCTAELTGGKLRKGPGRAPRRP